jgi:glyoxylase-like metal-dependent hydrolase (beta-lactamase superfamily II)/rhodanese-related sulfurtransferase
MHFQQFFLSCLAHASYFIGSEGEAVVIDPQRDIEQYLNEARERGVTIKYVIETHLHADFVSGHRELAERTGARIYLGAKANAGFPHVPIHDGDELRFGACKLTFYETPGHTVESVSIVVTDEARSPEPYAVFTGDTLFIGDVGRPDLGGEPRELAGMLYDSLHEKLLRLPDDVLVFPAHGAGSLCGRAMSDDRSSTIGRERATNYALQIADKAAFVDLMTEDLPDRPAYFASDVELNRSGAAMLSDLRELPALDPQQVLSLQEGGALVIDVRDEYAFGAAHLPESVNIGLDGQFASWAGQVVGLEVDIILLGEDAAAVDEARMRLTRVGIDRAIGYVRAGVAAWRAAGLPLATLPQIEPSAFAERVRSGLQTIDVRRDPEWSTGHVAGAVHLPLNRLLASLDDLDRERAVGVYCKSGYRSAIAGSLLQRSGFKEVVNLAGGIDAWSAAGLPAGS